MTETSSPKMALWLRVVLTVSLALNLAVVGLVAGAFLKDPPRRDRPEGRQVDRLPAELRELGPAPFFYALSPEDRRLLLEATREREKDLGASRSATMARLEEMLRLLRSEPYDAEKMRALLAEQRMAAVERSHIGEQLLLARFAAMSPEARAAYADRLDHSLRGRPSKRP